jgi:site-specific DNA-cytosine methylase
VPCSQFLTGKRSFAKTCSGQTQRNIEEGGPFSHAQWTKLQAREDVRLVDRDRGSRTIIASYKNAHSTFCEFVAGEEETAQLAAGSITLKQLSKPPRFFTPREVARLQGFPESFVTNWQGQRNPNRLYHQLGNAVCEKLSLFFW